MSGRAPFEPGDLVVCVGADATPDGRLVLARPGEHFHVAFMLPPDDLMPLAGFDGGWGFVAASDDINNLPSVGGMIAVRECAFYRRVEPKAQSFFAGDIDVPADQVPA